MATKNWRTVKVLARSRTHRTYVIEEHKKDDRFRIRRVFLEGDNGLDSG